MSHLASPESVRAVLASLGRADIPVAEGVPLEPNAVAWFDPEQRLDLARLAEAAPLCVILSVAWPEAPLALSYPRRDGIHPLPVTIRGNPEHEPIVAAASRLCGIPARLVTTPNDIEASYPLIRLLEPTRVADITQELRQGTAFLCPRSGATFVGLHASSTGVARRLVSPHQVLAVLIAEPAARRAIVDSQWRAVQIAADPTALRSVLREALGATKPEPKPPRRSIMSLPRVVIEGSIGSSFSLAVINRHLGLSLARRGLAVELRSSEGEVGDFDESERVRRLGPEYVALYRRTEDPRPEPSSCAILRLMYPPRADDFAPAALHLYSAYAWEETEFPRRWAEIFNRSVDAITVISAHVARCLRAAGYRGPILVVGCGTDHLPRPSERAKERARALLAGLPRQFTYLHVSSALPRKGIDVLLDAWQRLAARSDWSANLVLKTQRNEHNRVSEELSRRGMVALSHAPVLEIQDDLDEEVMSGLYAVVDAIVQPSRCEGLGLPMAEAILAGKPVIATAWSAHAEFCTPETSWPVAWRYQQARTHLSGFLSAWAEPDVDDLVAKMLDVRAASSEEVRNRTQRGKSILKEFYTWDTVAEKTEFALSTVRCDEFRARCLEPISLALVSTWNVRCGIADYASKQVSAFSPSQLWIVADARDDRLYEDDGRVRRVWRIGHSGNVDPILRATEGAEAVCLHFTFGLIDLSELASLISACTARGQAVVVVLHATEDRRNEAGIVTLRAIVRELALADLILVHTLADLERLRNMGLVDNVALFPHGVPVADPTRAPSEEIRRFRQRHDLLVAGFGYLLPHKGFVELLQVLPEIRDLAHRGGLGCLGLLLLTARYPTEASATTLAECRRVIRSLGLEQHVLLISDHTPEQDALAALSAADLLVYPYQYSQESSSAAVRFGLASGSPVAVTNIPIFADLGETVFRLSASSGRALAASLIEVLHCVTADNDSARQQATVRQAWVEEHRWDRVAERFHDVVHGLVCERRLGGAWAKARKTSLWRLPQDDCAASRSANIAVAASELAP